MVQHDENAEPQTDEYEAPAVEDLDASEGASVTAAGGTGIG